MDGTDFLKGISFEDDPFDGEQPDELRFFDFAGNEVIIDGSE